MALVKGLDKFKNLWYNIKKTKTGVAR